MKLEDRIQALKFSSKYRKDYAQHVKYLRKNKLADSCVIDHLAPVFNITPNGRTLCQKYKIPFPFDPDADIAVLPRSLIIPLHKGLKLPSIMPLPRSTNKKGEKVYGLKEDRYLTVSIDMSSNIDPLIAALKVLHKYYNPLAKRGKRNRDATLECMGDELSHWEVYILVEDGKRQGLTITELAKRMLDKNNKTINNSFESYYQRVTQFYNRAKNYIAEAESQA